MPSDLTPIRTRDEQLEVLEQAAAQAVQLSNELEMEAQVFRDLIDRIMNTQARMERINTRLTQTNQFVQSLKETLDADTQPI